MGQKEIINQKICSKFVDQHVILCISSLMENVLGDEGCQQVLEVSVDDIENLYAPAPDGDNDGETCGQEIYEWWVVDSYLFDWLQEKKEPVIEDFQNHKVWGRTTTGQAISIDGVIRNICHDMEILYGQKYSWADSV
jgi:hypothetical protein